MVLVRDARTQLEHAKALDPDNAVAQAFLDKVGEIARKLHETS